MSDRKPEDEPTTSHTKRRRIGEKEHQPNLLIKESQNEFEIEQYDAVNLQSEKAIDDIATIKATDATSIQELLDEITKLKSKAISDSQTMKDDHIKEMAEIIESHKKEMLEMTEKVKKLETKIAKYEMLPEIFKLDIDCVQEMFDWLRIKDIHSVSETCIRMQRIAGDYLKTQLSALQFELHYNGEKLMLNGFKEFAQRLVVCSLTNIKGYRFIGRKCKSLKQITFARFLELNATKIEYIKPILSKIESVSISRFYGEFYENFLQFCPKLKNLIIYVYNRKTMIGTNNQWLRRSYPTLEHLELCFETVENVYPELETFFEQNLSLQKISINERGFLGNINSMLQAKIKVQVLSLTISEKDDNKSTIRHHLNQLHDQGFYKQLHISILSYDQRIFDMVSSLDGLEKLYFQWSNKSEIFNLNLLINLKELGLDYSDARSLKTFVNDFESIAKSLVNLERLFISNIKYEIIEPFIRYSAKLKAIKIDLFKRKFIDLSPLNKKREQLVGAKKVTIYLHENTYLATKWGNKTTDLKMIEVKRADSYDWQWPSVT